MKISFQFVTLPFIEQEQFTLEWIYSILSHKQEADTIIFEDEDVNEGFILVPDFKVKQSYYETFIVSGELNFVSF